MEGASRCSYLFPARSLGVKDIFSGKDFHLRRHQPWLLWIWYTSWAWDAPNFVMSVTARAGILPRLSPELKRTSITMFSLGRGTKRLHCRCSSTTWLKYSLVSIKIFLVNTSQHFKWRVYHKLSGNNGQLMAPTPFSDNIITCYPRRYKLILQVEKHIHLGMKVWVWSPSGGDLLAGSIITDIRTQEGTWHDIPLRFMLNQTNVGTESITKEKGNSL